MEGKRAKHDTLGCEVEGTKFPGVFKTLMVLLTAIKEANAKFPFHAPINTTHAFELGSMPITLDYLLWAIAKSHRKGAHPMEMLLTLENKWPEANSMLEAYDELLSATEG